MPWWPRLRSSAALYSLPPMLVLTFLVVNGNSEFMPDTWRAATTTACSAISFIAPVAAAAAAWESWRMHTAGFNAAVAARSRAVVLAWFLIPVVAAGCVSLLFALALVAPKVWGIPGAPYGRVLGATVLVLVAWTVVGAAAGRRLHPLVSMPAVLVGTWFCLAYAPALSAFWPRHVTGGDLTTCCDATEVIEPRLLLGQSILAAGLILGGAVLWGSVSRRRFVVAGSAAVLIAVALAAAVVPVRGLGPQPSLARSESDLECLSRSGLELCLFPEHRPRADEVAAVLAPAVRGLTTAGLEAPRRLTEGRADRRTSWNFVVQRTSGGKDVVFSLATGLLPASPKECSERKGDTMDLYYTIGIWLTAKAGLSSTDVADRVPRETLAAVARVLDLPDAEQRRWFERNRAALRNCSITPIQVT